MATDSLEPSINKSTGATDNPQWADTLHGADRHLALKVMRGQTEVAGAPLDLSPPGLQAVSKPTPMQYKATVPLPRPRPFETAPSPACAPSPAYQDYITFAERKIWNIKSLGDPNTLMHRFDCDIHNTRDAMAKANIALKITGDRYNKVQTPEKSQRENEEFAGTPSTVGIRAQSALVRPENKAKHQSAIYSSIVDDLIPGSPADNAGLRVGDKITSLNGNSTAHMTGEDIEDLLSGKNGTNVKLGLVREGKRFDVTLTRQNIEMPTVRAGLDIGNGVGYVQMFNFGDNTVEDLTKALDDVKNAKVLVIDLRDNGGGVLDSAIEAAELLVKRGVIVRTDERMESDIRNPQYEFEEYSVNDTSRIVTTTRTDGTSGSTSHERWPYMANGRPIIVLTNELTASAAEVLAGALRDSAGATLIGEQTFGKGMGQTIRREMTGGAAVKVTSLHYTTPSGEWPGDADNERHGLKPLPQFVVHNPTHAYYRTAADLQLARAKQLAAQLMPTP